MVPMNVDGSDECRRFRMTVTDDVEDKPICEMNVNADNYRLCNAKSAHDTVLRKTDASLAMKTLTAT